MKVAMKKLFVWFCLLLMLIGLLLAPGRSARAQTEPEGTPQNGYPPPATPAQPEEGYPSQPTIPTSTAADEAYLAPTLAPLQESAPETVIGSGAAAPTAVPNLPISQSTLVRNRAILWAGFSITLLIFSMSVYGAMLMYTRRRS
jgi:hypothetical protein